MDSNFIISLYIVIVVNSVRRQIIPGQGLPDARDRSLTSLPE